MCGPFWSYVPQQPWYPNIFTKVELFFFFFFFFFLNAGVCNGRGTPSHKGCVRHRHQDTLLEDCFTDYQSEEETLSNKFLGFDRILLRRVISQMGVPYGNFVRNAKCLLREGLFPSITPGNKEILSEDLEDVSQAVEEETSPTTSGVTSRQEENVGERGENVPEGVEEDTLGPMDIASVLNVIGKANENAGIDLGHVSCGESVQFQDLASALLSNTDGISFPNAGHEAAHGVDGKPMLPSEAELASVMNIDGVPALNIGDQSAQSMREKFCENAQLSSHSEQL